MAAPPKVTATSYESLGANAGLSLDLRLGGFVIGGDVSGRAALTGDVAGATGYSAMLHIGIDL